MSKYEVSVIVKIHRQVSVESENLEKAIHDAKDQMSKEFGDVTWNDIEVVEIQEDFI